MLNGSCSPQAFPKSPAALSSWQGKQEGRYCSSLRPVAVWLCWVCRDSCSTLCVQGSAIPIPCPGLQLGWAVSGKEKPFHCCHLLKGKELQVFIPSAHPAGQTH